MKIKEVTIGLEELRSDRTNFSNKKYSISLKAILKDGENYEEVANKLREKCQDMINFYFDLDMKEKTKITDEEKKEALSWYQPLAIAAKLKVPIYEIMDKNGLCLTKKQFEKLKAIHEIEQFNKEKERGILDISDIFDKLRDKKSKKEEAIYVYFYGNCPKCGKYIVPGFGILPGKKCVFCDYIFKESDWDNERKE